MNLCLYGASSENINEIYKTEVEKLGRLMAQRGHALIFGGGASGLMGAAARGVFSENGKIIGVSPNFFNVDGILFENCTDLIYTETMRERKQVMEDMSDGFVVLPGGIGTYEEFFEILTSKQLGLHGKAISVFNINGYFDEMLVFLEKAISEGFMKPACRELFKVFDSAEDVVFYMETYREEKHEIGEYKFFNKK